ncbi:MAG: transporter substrate-binding domain-containing protein [Clostridia bacterium]|nr:transporter substrate-binding domain-containing protein [Clostridia bacterium]
MKKIISLFLVALMAFGCVSVFASCDSGKDENVLTMATNAEFPPYEFKEGDGYAGIDVEIAQAIAKRLGKELKIVDIEFGSIIGGVQTGKYDFGMAGLTVTDERKESVNFSQTYATGVQVIIVKKDSAIQSLDDIFDFNEEGDPVALKNIDIKVGVQQDTTGDIYCSDDVTKWGFNTCDAEGVVKIDRITRYPSGADAVEGLKSGKVDMVVIDNEPAKSFVAANEGAVRILEGDNEYAVEDYAICVSKSNTQLLKDINEALTALKSEGVIDKIIAKYINAGETEGEGEATE